MNDFASFGLEQLIDMYCNAENELKQALIDGALWEEVRDKRAVVTKLAQVIYNKRTELDNGTPADTQIRCD
jgi:hypothetical protein